MSSNKMKYRALFRIHSKLAFGHLVIDVAGSPYLERLQIIDEKIDVDGKRYSTGNASAILDFTEETSLEIIQEKGMALLEQLLSKFSLLARSYIEIEKLILIIDISPDTLVRWFRQYEEVPALIEASRNVNDPDIIAFIGREHVGSSSPRVNRAIRWYWKGINEKDPLDAFLNFWIGLEAINDGFPTAGKVALKCKNQHEITKCPECSIGLRGIKPTLGGVKHLFRKMGYKDTDYELIESLRHEVTHSLPDKKLSELQIASKGVLCQLEAVLRYGILELLHLNEEAFIPHLSLLKQKTVQVVEGKIEESDINALVAPLVSLSATGNFAKIEQGRAIAQQYVISNISRYTLSETKSYFLSDQQVLTCIAK